MRICVHVSICSTHLIGPPNVVPAIFLVLRLDDFQLVLHGTLAEDGALEERNKSAKRCFLHFHPFAGMCLTVFTSLESPRSDCWERRSGSWCVRRPCRRWNCRLFGLKLIHVKSCVLFNELCCHLQNLIFIFGLMKKVVHKWRLNFFLITRYLGLSKTVIEDFNIWDFFIYLKINMVFYSVHGKFV